MSTLNPYQVLGLAPDATNEEIRRTYRSLARKYHPDMNTSPGAEDRFKELAQAFSILTNSGRRSLYDEFGEASLHLGFDPQEARRRQAEERCGENIPPGPRPDARGSADPPYRPGDVVEPLEIDLGLAIRGGDVRIPSPTGRSTLSLTLPPGVEDGARLRLPGRGRLAGGGARPGDLYVEVRVRPNPHYRRDGLDLHLELPISVSEAVRGISLEVPAPGGHLRLSIPPGRQGGEVLRLKAKGLRVPGGRAGDLFVHLCLRLPEKTGPVTRALDQLSNLYQRHVREDLKL